MGFLAALIPGILSGLFGVIGKKAEVTQDGIKAASEAVKEALTAQGTNSTATGQIIAAEATSESSLTRMIRPMILLWCMVIITGKWLISVYFMARYGYIPAALAAPFDAQLMNFLEIGLTGYIASRGIEKVVTAIVQGNTISKVLEKLLPK